jgi:hypothetical protein
MKISAGIPGFHHFREGIGSLDEAIFHINKFDPTTRTGIVTEDRMLRKGSSAGDPRGFITF